MAPKKSPSPLEKQKELLSKREKDLWEKIGDLEKFLSQIPEKTQELEKKNSNRLPPLDDFYTKKQALRSERQQRRRRDSRNHLSLFILFVALFLGLLLWIIRAVN